MKVFDALKETRKRRDEASTIRLETNQVESTIEYYCTEYIKAPGDTFTFEALSSAIDATIDVLESDKFRRKYTFTQISETCFRIQLLELNFLD